MSSAVDLKTRFGGGGRNPSDIEMKAAICEVFHEDHPNLVEGDYAEHPNSWLSFGVQTGDKWIVHILDLYRGGRLIFSKYDDQDDAEPVFERTKQYVSEQEAWRLWRLLASGEIESLMREDWM
jgi:hypothetical protein